MAKNSEMIQQLESSVEFLDHMIKKGAEPEELQQLKKERAQAYVQLVRMRAGKVNNVEEHQRSKQVQYRADL